MSIKSFQSTTSVQYGFHNANPWRFFFKYSPKCQRKLEEAVAEADTEGCLKKKIKPLCETCWVERHTGFDDLNQLYKPLVNCFELIQSNSDPNNWFDAKFTTEAAGHLKHSTEFVLHHLIPYMLLPVSIYKRTF